MKIDGMVRRKPAVGDLQPKRWNLIGLLALVCAAVFSELRPSYAGVGGFTFGQLVETHSAVATVNLRGEPGLAGRIVNTLPNGTTVTIVGGPQVVDGANWWEVDGGTRHSYGWAAESLLKAAGTTEAQDAAARRAGCALTGPAYPGVYHCQRANDVHVVVIDLNDPHVRFETVMAQDVNRVDSPVQEWVSVMAERNPAAVAAINGDYFFPGRHGPEGLTLRQGERLDNLTTMERSALVIGQAPLDAPDAGLPIPAGIVRLIEADRPLDPATYFNAVGGGPQLVFDKTWDWTEGFNFPGYRGCQADLPPDQVINGECLANIDDWRIPEKPWSAAGLTADQKMVWVVGPYAHLAETLAAFDVVTAIKLDSGGSSQLWYARTMVEGYRPVANGLLVFYERSMEAAAPIHWPVHVEGEARRLQVTLHNTGADTWVAGQVWLATATGETAVPLPRDVQPGEAVTLRWTAPPFAECGLRQDTWHLMAAGKLFPGPGIAITSVILPASMAGERASLSAQMRAWQAQTAWTARRPVWAELARELHAACQAGGNPASTG